tara:strand:+ start:49574 stop:49924 length:351 start_codon:yes stop_codon:yes gene_type:complete
MEYSVKTLTTKNIPKFSVVRTSEMGPLGMTREDGSQYTEDLNLLLKNNQVINCIVREGIVKLFLSKNRTIIIDTQSMVEEIETGVILSGNWGRADISIPWTTRAGFTNKLKTHFCC